MSIVAAFYSRVSTKVKQLSYGLMELYGQRNPNTAKNELNECGDCLFVRVIVTRLVDGNFYAGALGQQLMAG